MQHLTTTSVATPIIPLSGVPSAGPGAARSAAFVPMPPALDACLSIRLSRLADALSTACVAELEVFGMPAFDPAMSGWHDEAEAGWATARERAEALVMGQGDDSAARWSRCLGRAVIDVLDADTPGVARLAFRRIDALLEALPPSLRNLESRSLARLRSCLTGLSDLCDAIDGRADRRAAAPPG